MNITCKNPIFLKKIIDALCIFIEEANIQCDHTGLSLQAMDHSKVSFISMHLKRNFFETFVCNSQMTLGLKLRSIQQFMKCVDNNVTLQIKTNDKKTKLKLKVTDMDQSLDFSTDLINIETDKIIFPELQPSATITMSTNDFRDMINDLNTNGDKIDVTVSKNQIFISPDRNPNSTIRLSSVNPTQAQIISRSDNPFESCFPIRYLNLFTKASPLSDTVTIEISENYPLKSKFTFPNDNGYIHYYLAPIGENETFLITNYRQRVTVNNNYNNINYDNFNDNTNTNFNFDINNTNTTNTTTNTNTIINNNANTNTNTTNNTNTIINNTANNNTNTTTNNNNTNTNNANNNFNINTNNNANYDINYDNNNNTTNTNNDDDLNEDAVDAFFGLLKMATKGVISLYNAYKNFNNDNDNNNNNQ